MSILRRQSVPEIPPPPSAPTRADASVIQAGQRRTARGGRASLIGSAGTGGQLQSAARRGRRTLLGGS